jgi:hypothetical protein
MKTRKLLLALFVCATLAAGKSPAQQPRGRAIQITNAVGETFRVANAEFPGNCLEFGVNLRWGRCVEFLLSEHVRMVVPVRSVRAMECTAGSRSDIPWTSGEPWSSIVAMPFCRVTHVLWGSEAVFSAKLSSSIIGQRDGKDVSLRGDDVRRIVFEGEPGAFGTAPRFDARAILADGSALALADIRPRYREMDYGGTVTRGEVRPGVVGIFVPASGAALEIAGTTFTLGDGQSVAVASLRAIDLRPDGSATMTMRDGSTRNVILSAHPDHDIHGFAGISEHGFVTFYAVKRVHFSSGEQ